MGSLVSLFGLPVMSAYYKFFIKFFIINLKLIFTMDKFLRLTYGVASAKLLVANMTAEPFLPTYIIETLGVELETCHLHDAQIINKL